MVDNGDACASKVGDTPEMACAGENIGRKGGGRCKFCPKFGRNIDAEPLPFTDLLQCMKTKITKLVVQQSIHYALHVSQ